MAAQVVTSLRGGELGGVNQGILWMKWPTRRVESMAKVLLIKLCEFRMPYIEKFR